MQSIVCHSDAVETQTVIDGLLTQARGKLSEGPPQAGILFASVEYEHADLLQAVQDEWPEMHLIGASSDGELSSELGFRHDSVVLTLFAGADLEVQCGSATALSEGIEQAVDRALDSCDDLSPSLCLTVCAPSTNTSEIVRVLNQRLEGPCPILGGLSGDHREFSEYCEFHGSHVLKDSICILLLKGDFQFSWGLGSGWFPIGERLHVTRSEGHIVHEIEGRPAIDIYHDHYGSVPSDSLGEYPLAVFTEGDEESWTLRAIMDSDEESGSLRFAGEVVEGSIVSITEILPDGLLSGSTQSLLEALNQFAGNDPQLALVFSCAARKWVLGTEAEEEIERMRDCARGQGVADLQIAGLYVYGEISPRNGELLSTFHNETCVSLVLGQ